MRGAASSAQRVLPRLSLVFRSGRHLSFVFSLPLGKPMACAHTVVHAVDLLELRDTLQRVLIKGNFALESMQRDPFEQVTQGNVVVFCESFEHLDHSFFHSYADLYALDRNMTVF